MKYWGVYREREHSPKHEFDDAEILRLTGARLAILREARIFVPVDVRSDKNT